MSDIHERLAQLERERDELRELLWECHVAASDGIPEPLERWLQLNGPQEMPQDIRDLRDAYDSACEERDAVSATSMGDVIAHLAEPQPHLRNTVGKVGTRGWCGRDVV